MSYNRVHRPSHPPANLPLSRRSTTLQLCQRRMDPSSGSSHEGSDRSRCSRVCHAVFDATLHQRFMRWSIPNTLLLTLFLGAQHSFRLLNHWPHPWPHCIACNRGYHLMEFVRGRYIQAQAPRGEF